MFRHALHLHLKNRNTFFMKKYLIVLVSFFTLMSCNNGNNTGDTSTDGEKQNATANDSTKQPNGMTTDAAISTDTAAMRTKKQ
jgi:hypothetical protein